jgi:hypothetical protein
MLTDDQRKSREVFIAIAVIEHHQMIEPKIDTYRICDRLGAIWNEVKLEAEKKDVSVQADSILSLN